MDSVQLYSLIVLPQTKDFGSNQVNIAQWLARRLAIGEVAGPNPGKGANLLISD